MAWTTPKTDWQTAHLVTAAEMNAYLRDNSLRIGSHLSFSTWAPTVGVVGTTTCNLGATPTKSGSYMRLGTTDAGLVHGSCLIKYSSDSVAGVGRYTITLPVNCSSSDTARQHVVGHGAIYDNSGADTHHVICVQYSSALCNLKYTCTGSTETWVTGAAPFAWSSNDQIMLRFCYEVC